MKIIIAAAVALLPVAAAAQTPAEPGSNVTAPTPSGGSSAAPAKPTRYCVLTDQTGTRIQRRTCLTREAWLAQGYDPLEDVRR